MHVWQYVRFFNDEVIDTILLCFYSDIPDFVDISNKSEPMQIVTLLNNFYSFLDSKLEYYDVYKVETIGSTYMVVSGVPLRNGNRHVVEIATMAIDILASTEDFVIPHLPGRQLVLRIGFHTGLSGLMAGARMSVLGMGFEKSNV